MKQLLITIFAFACISGTYAQNENPNAANIANGSFSPWHNNGDEKAILECYTLVTDANIREKPNATAAVVSKLPIATKVTIEQVTADTLTLNGFPAPWCKVAYTFQGKKMSGYIWGGTLAFAILKNTDEYNEDLKGLVYLVGMSKFDGKLLNTTLQIRAARNGVEISKTEFKTAGDIGYYLDIERYSEQNLKNIKDVFEIKSYYPACGYGSGKNLMFFTGKTISRVLETSDNADGGVFYSKEDVILPQDKGGIAGHIMVVSDMATFEEKEVKGVFETKMSSQEYKVTLYKWNGEKLAKLKDWK